MIPIVGPSYVLECRTADVQRTVNMRPVPVESGTGRAQFMLRENPGLVLVVALGGEGRGAHDINGRIFVVVADKLYEVYASGAYLERGTLYTSSGRVSLDANTTQVFMVDGVAGYVFTLATNAFVGYPDVVGMAGSVRTAYFDQMAVFAPPGNSFYISALGDASSVDPLDFASAEASPDSLVSFVVVNRQLYLGGMKSMEVWLNTGADPDMPLQRYDGTVMSVGVLAAHSLQECNGTPVWLGASKESAGSIWMADGYSPRRISTRAIEEALQGSSNLAGAYAYSWAWQGSAMYCLRVPGLETTLAYDFLTQSWHEQAEFTDGAFSQHRVCATMVSGQTVYALGDDGDVYRYDDSIHNFAGDVKCRDRISPHDRQQGSRKFFKSFELGVDTGVTGEAMLRMSNDGGAVWGDWRRKSLGAIGKQKQRLIWNRCGSAQDRVWQVRCTDDVPFDIVDADA